jgi:hypothetical protein
MAYAMDARCAERPLRTPGKVATMTIWTILNFVRKRQQERQNAIAADDYLVITANQAMIP